MGNELNYVEEAHKKIQSVKKDGKIEMTKTQIRKFLSAANSVNNKLMALEATGQIEGDKLPEKIINDCLALKVQLVYQCARESKVKEFVEKTGLLEKLDNVGDSVDRLKKYFKYIEALVAYHKFEGGRD